MTDPGRRDFFLACAGLVVPVVVGCEKKLSTEDLLSHLVSDYVVPRQKKLQQSTVALARAIDQLSSTATEQALGDTRAAWTAAALTYKETKLAVQLLLPADTQFQEATFFPARPHLIENALRHMTSADARPPQQTFVHGIYGLEYLLFGDTPKETVPVLRPEKAGISARQVAVMATSELTAAVSSLDSKIGTPRSSAALKFCRGSKDALKHVVEEMVSAVELDIQNSLATVLEMQKIGQLKPGDIEGYRSGLSTHLLQAHLRSVKECFAGSGAGLRKKLRQVAAHEAEEVDEAFQEAEKCLARLHQPLEQEVLHPDGMRKAQEALKLLERRLKVDLAWPLAVSLAPIYSDGD